MRKTLSLLYRMLLIAGVLVALTPCGLCQKDKINSPQACSMMDMSGKMDCCHKAKSTNPFCKVMDQSSLSVDSQHIVVPAISAGLLLLSAYSVPKTVEASSLFYSGCSSPPGLLPLRI